jgi:hypothetical protein
MTRIQLSPEEQAERARKEFRAQWEREYRCAVDHIIPAKFRDVNQNIQPSPKNRMPLEEQAALYKEINERPLEGWAFFAPAGYGKTTVSWLLFKYAMRENIKHALWTGQQEFVLWDNLGPSRMRPFLPCYVWHIVVPEWLEQIQASWENPNVVKPALMFDKFPKGEQQGFRPRVFLEEIDKVKTGSEWAANKLFTLLNAVDKHKAQLVLDTNLSKRQFLERFGEPIYRRVKENCNLREFGFQ